MINLKKSDPTDLRKSVVEPVLAVMKALDIKANVYLVLDDSTSMKEEYEEDHVQLIADRALALSMVWDPDQKVEIFALNKGYIGMLDTLTFRGWVSRNVRCAGKTPFTPVLADIVRRVTPAAISFVDRLRSLVGLPKQAAPIIPTYVIFITDGECDDPSLSNAWLVEASDKPVFFQFVGLGEKPLKYLHSLKNLGGRRIVNTGFFRMPCEDEEAVVKDAWVYQQLTTEFSSWIKAARSAGILA